MKTIWPWALLAIAATLAALSAGPAAAASGDPEATLAADFARNTDAPGVAVSVVDLEGRPVDESTHGHDGNGEPIDTDTPFVWGSVSKSVTAAAIDAAGLDPDLPVVEALPFLSGSPLAESGATIGDLLNHTSGLPHVLAATDKDRREGALQTLEGPDSPLAGVGLGTRGEFAYSSLNYLLLQAVLETQGDLAATVGRSAPGVITSYDAFAAQVPPGHVPLFGLNRPRTLAQDHAGLGYGYLAGSVDVLAGYAAQQARLRLPGGPGERLPATVARSGTKYASGWYVDKPDGAVNESDIYHHSGAVPGFFTHVELAPAKGRAVVIVANRYGEMESGRLAEQARATASAALDSGDAQPAGTPWLYIVALGAGALAVLAVWVRVAFAWQARRTRSQTGALAEAAAAGLAVAGVIAVPAYIGYPLSVAVPWAPDVAILLGAFGGFAALLALVCAGTAVTGRYRRTS